MADNETPPIVVPATPGPDQIAAVVRVVVLVIGIVTALAGFVSKHDIAGFVAYIQSSAFLTAAAVIVSAVTFVWGQLKTRHRSIQLTTIAEDARVPDAVAKVAPK